MKAVIPVVLISGIFMFYLTANAKMYSWRDSNGVLHFDDTPDQYAVEKSNEDRKRNPDDPALFGGSGQTQGKKVINYSKMTKSEQLLRKDRLKNEIRRIQRKIQSANEDLYNYKLSHYDRLES